MFLNLDVQVLRTETAGLLWFAKRYFPFFNTISNERENGNALVGTIDANGQVQMVAGGPQALYTPQTYPPLAQCPWYRDIADMAFEGAWAWSMSRTLGPGGPAQNKPVAPAQRMTASKKGAAMGAADCRVRRLLCGALACAIDLPRACSMHQIRCAVCALALGFLAPAWAINKCTASDGKVSFQDAPCEGQGEKIEVRPVVKGAAPIQPPRSITQEGAFGPTWQRKNYLQAQGIPQARAALERNQSECAAASAEAVAHAGPLRRGNLPQGSQFVQELEAASTKDKAACEARSEELRKQLKALEKELEGL